MFSKIMRCCYAVYLLLTHKTAHTRIADLARTHVTIPIVRGPKTEDRRFCRILQKCTRKTRQKEGLC